MENKTEKIHKPKLEHVALALTSTLKINKWFEQINAKKKIKLSRKDLINWLIERLPENLSAGDLNALIDKFYDNEKYLRQLLREVKAAKASGSDENLDIILKTKKLDARRDQEEVPVSNPSSLGK